MVQDDLYFITPTPQGPLLSEAFIHAADIQDRDGASAVLLDAKDRISWLRHILQPVVC